MKKFPTKSQIRDGLIFSLGPVVIKAINDQKVSEIMVNPDGTIWIDGRGRDMELVGTINEDQANKVVGLVANSLGFEANEQNPVVLGVLPLGHYRSKVGIRFCGLIPPIVSPMSSFTLRMPFGRRFYITSKRPRR